MGESSRTPPQGIAIVLKMIADVKTDLTNTDNRLTTQIGAVNEKVDSLRNETATQSASLARIETTLNERKRTERAQTETTRYKRKRNIGLLSIAGVLLTLATALLTHALGG